jgi:HPt (histidine-containing phosphotransfer) domain-containing protein
MSGYVLLDIEFILENFKEDLDFVPELMKTYLDKTPPKFEILKDNISKKNKEGIKEMAHHLKGSVSIFGAVPLVDNLKKIECAGLDGNFDLVNEIFKVVIEQFNVLTGDLELFISKS